MVRTRSAVRIRATAPEAHLLKERWAFGLGEGENKKVLAIIARTDHLLLARDLERSTNREDAPRTTSAGVVHHAVLLIDIEQDREGPDAIGNAHGLTHLTITETEKHLVAHKRCRQHLIADHPIPNHAITRLADPAAPDHMRLAIDLGSIEHVSVHGVVLNPSRLVPAGVPRVGEGADRIAFDQPELVPSPSLSVLIDDAVDLARVPKNAILDLVVRHAAAVNMRLVVHIHALIVARLLADVQERTEVFIEPSQTRHAIERPLNHVTVGHQVPFGTLRHQKKLLVHDTGLGSEVEWTDELAIQDRECVLVVVRERPHEAVVDQVAIVHDVVGVDLVEHRTELMAPAAHHLIVRQAPPNRQAIGNAIDHDRFTGRPALFGPGDLIQRVPRTAVRILHGHDLNVDTIDLTTANVFRRHAEDVAEPRAEPFACIVTTDRLLQVVQVPDHALLPILAVERIGRGEKEGGKK